VRGYGSASQLTRSEGGLRLAGQVMR